ncbi:hypothetical protein, partial [Hymenobacter seoulensis]
MATLPAPAFEIHLNEETIARYLATHTGDPESELETLSTFLASEFQRFYHQYGFLPGAGDYYTTAEGNT